MKLGEQIEQARAVLARLEQAAATATCAEVGHRWESLGGAGCGCPDGSCSVPVFTCKTCGDCDYGDNEDADYTRRECAERR